ncbi:hypothetical protein E2562_030132 [Oryza meyeriana var. granulata]|uniref:Glutamine amidotransferase type-2 domain-containing protein n=1 Tax=Oryza meyeriana var. granulata TaxID=110450 RepID=A0A6G1BPD7_9ORYZ|nr:hypothetical protein E2562_030132 [Oryza meyeriana var. granulata]
MDDNDEWPWWNRSASLDLETPPSSSVSSSSLDLVPRQRQAERPWQRTDLEERTKQEEACSHTPSIPTPDRSTHRLPPFPPGTSKGGDQCHISAMRWTGWCSTIPTRQGTLGEGGDGDDGGPVFAGSFIVLTAAVAVEPEPPHFLSQPSVTLQWHLPFIVRLERRRRNVQYVWDHGGAGYGDDDAPAPVVQGNSSRRVHVLELSRWLKHRGPDSTSHIIDSASGNQPLYNEDKTVTVTINDKIYNHEELRRHLSSSHTFRTGSNCEVITHLLWMSMEYDRVLVALPLSSSISRAFCYQLCKYFNKEFSSEQIAKHVSRQQSIKAYSAASLHVRGAWGGVRGHAGRRFDARNHSFIAARDAIGWGIDGSVWISSEMKAPNDDCEHLNIFHPGHIYSGNNGGSFL